MIIKLKKSDIKTIKEENGLYSYSLKTRKGTMRVEGIKTEEDAIISAEENLKVINKSILKK